MRVFVHDFVGLACKAGDKLHEVVLAFHEIGLCDNLVFQWLHRRDNRVEVIVDGRNMVNYLNGVKVLELTDASLDQGRLLIQSEGAEIYYRRIELHPLDRK